jgi:predicted GNAT family N-acyltransferase
LASPEIEIRRVESLAELDDALLVRRAVFIDEQGVPESLEVDAYDAAPAFRTYAAHVVGYVDGRVVATGRLILDGPPDEHAHIGRIAVLADWRRHGFGRQIMLGLQAIARQQGFAGITLSAQLHAIGFYEGLGYRQRGDVFLDAGIEHRWMDLALEVNS